MGDARVHYARNGDVRLAYRVLGESGPVVVQVPGWMVSNVDSIDNPDSPYAPFVEAFQPVAQFVVWDRRAAGLSDPSTHVLSLEERMADLRSVMDAVGADSVSFVGSSEGAATCIVFAATYPARVRSMALYGTAARFAKDLPDFPWGFTPAEIESQLAEIESSWGEGALAELYHGPSADVPGVREMFGKLQRSVASPMMAKRWWQAFMDLDIRGVLGAVNVPTLVMARPGDRFVPIEASANLAAVMPNARFLKLPEGPHSAFDIADEMASHAVRFVCEQQPERVDERVLKTVLFTDIVGSTEQLSEHGDAHWRHQLDRHDSVVDAMLARYGGFRANHTGDGIFALFDSPTMAARCALDLVPALAARGISIRAGIHTGECERRGDEWSGMAIHTGARIGAMAGAGDVLTSRTVRDLSAGSGLVFESRGPQRLKGLPEEIEVYRVTAP
jgi:class 3 adenylate cyclase